jgi:hypothetical protein
VASAIGSGFNKLVQSTVNAVSESFCALPALRPRRANTARKREITCKSSRHNRYKPRNRRKRQVAEGSTDMTTRNARTLAIAIAIASFAEFSIAQEPTEQKIDFNTGRTASEKIESTKLPKVPSVASMVSPQTNVEGMFQRSATDSSFDSSEKLLDYGTRTTIAESDHESIWAGSIYTWAAPNFYSQPLYFEQVNLERYDSKIAPCLRPAVSYAQFLGSIPVLPYKVGGQPIHSRAYTLGHWRPGNSTPHQIHWGPRTTRGLIYQGMAVTGAVFLLP